MIIYNVTIKVENEIADEWVHWMKSVHIPDVLKTGVFNKHQFCRVMSVRDTDGVTFAVQYECPSTAALHQYQMKHAPALQKEHNERYEGKFVAFRSIMEVL